MKEVGHRCYHCPCGYENDRDVIAVMNLYGSLTLSIYERCNLESMRGTSLRGGSQALKVAFNNI